MKHSIFQYLNDVTNTQHYTRIVVNEYRFINSQIKINKNNGQDNNYCFIDVIFKNPPESYTKLLKIFCSKVESNKQIYEENKKTTTMILSKYMDVLQLDNHVEFRLADQIKYKARIIKIAYNKMMIFTDISREISILKEKLSLEFTKENISFFVNAIISDISDSNEVEGFLFITFDMDYSFSLVDSLNPLYAYYNKMLSEK